MSANVCHVSVHADEGRDAVDLVLPLRLPLASLIPDIVELAAAGHTGTPGPWQLATVGGTVLDESITLREQGIGDGDLLLLSPALPAAPAFGRANLATAVITSAPAGSDTRALRATAGLVAASAGITACAVARSAATATLLTAVALFCVVAGAAVATSRSDRGDWVCGPLGCLAVGMAALCAALAVPGPSGGAHLLLAAAATTAASLVLLRLGIGSPILSTASACGGALGVAAMSAAVLWHLPAHAAGVVLALLAVGALSLAPRLSVVIAGLAPAPSLTEEPHPDADQRASAGHRALTGLVVGSCTAAGVGAAVVAVECLRGSGRWLPDVVLCAVVGAALLMRARCYAAGRCRWALTLAGTWSLTAGFAALVAEYGHWAGAVAVCLGVVAISRNAPPEPSPIASRALEVFEYAVLAAVVPAACAALGLFGLVRAASLL